MPHIALQRPGGAQSQFPPLLLRIERVAPALVAYAVVEGGEPLAQTLQTPAATRRMRARLGQDVELGHEFRDQPKRFLIQIGGFSLRIRAEASGFVWELEEAGEIIGRARQTRDADRAMRRQLGTDDPLTPQPAARTRRRGPMGEAAIALASDLAARGT